MQPHPFSLRQLQYAVAVADAGGFRRAADLCHVSQPSLSAQLALLESSLGVRLFERDRRRVILTRAGETLIARARAILTEVDEMQTAARHLCDPLSGTIQVGVIPTVSPYLLPQVASTLREKYRRLTIAWREEKTPDLLAALERGALDAALLASVAGMENLETAVLLEDEFILAGPKDHALLRKRGPVHASELEDAAVLLLDDGHCLRDQALAVCARTSVRESDFRATSLATLTQMVVGGAGVTLLPALALEVENRRGELAIRRFATPRPRRSLVLAWRRQSPLAEALEAIAATIRDTLEPPKLG